MSSHPSIRKHLAATGGRVPTGPRKSDRTAQPVQRRLVTVKLVTHVRHVAGGVGTAVALETAARLICEHVLPVAVSLLH